MASEQTRASARAWRRANPELVKEEKRRYWERHGARINAERTAARHANVEKAREEARAYYAKNRARITQRNNAFRAANPDMVKRWRQENRLNRRAAYILFGIKKACKDKRLAYDLTEEWLDSRLKAGVCEMSGLPFDMSLKRGANSPSVDRIIPGGPYTQANCRVILWSINKALSNYGEDYLLDVFARVLARRGRHDPGA